MAPAGWQSRAQTPPETADMTDREDACCAGASASAADALADKASDTAQKLTEQGGSLPDAAASTSQITPVADSLADKASQGAQKLAEQGSGLPDAAASTSQVAPAVESLADKASQGAQKLAEQGSGLPDAAASTSQAAPGTVEAAGQYLTCSKLFYKVSALLSGPQGPDEGHPNSWRGSCLQCLRGQHFDLCSSII